MISGHEEALQLLRGWLDSGTDLRCNVETSHFVFTMKGRIWQIKDDDITVISEDHESELVARLLKVQEFNRVASQVEPQYGKGLICRFDDNSVVSFAEMLL